MRASEREREILTYLLKFVIIFLKSGYDEKWH